MAIWMVSGLHDPRWLPNVLGNFARQTYTDKRLLIVENGKGLGSCFELPEKVSIIQSDPGVGQYITAALHWLREIAKDDSWFAKCDADDYYGPGYLTKISSLVKTNADYAGSKSLYIRNTENILWFAESKDAKFVFHGPTLTGRISSALDFPNVAQWGEDDSWCRMMAADRRVCVELPPENFCYQRFSGNKHTWPCTDEELRVLWQVDFQDLGSFDEDIVNGIVPRPIPKILKTPKMTADNFMPWRILRERGISYVGN
ncbi:glycosyltransferase family 2 protein [Candidatus Pacearchaeota archaeon]|jgi:hypothetical protein|nr:glycosyltransferase family 2 protein [Candidatus Pacearchaeota archaeon]